MRDENHPVELVVARAELARQVGRRRLDVQQRVVAHQARGREADEVQHRAAEIQRPAPGSRRRVGRGPGRSSTPFRPQRACAWNRRPARSACPRGSLADDQPAVAVDADVGRAAPPPGDRARHRPRGIRPRRPDRRRPPRGAASAPRPRAPLRRKRRAVDRRPALPGVRLAPDIVAVDVPGDMRPPARDRARSASASALSPAADPVSGVCAGVGRRAQGDPERRQPGRRRPADGDPPRARRRTW